MLRVRVAYLCSQSGEHMQIVSWGELIVGLVVSGVIWYGFVVLRYYRSALHGWSAPHRRQPSSVRWTREEHVADAKHHAAVTEVTAKNDPHAQVHELMQELKLVFAAAVRDHLQKEQIIEAIGLRLPKYTSLPLEIKESINQHISNEFSLQLKMKVSAEEMNALW